MVRKQVEFDRVRSARLSGLVSVQVSVDSDGEWLYVEVVRGVLQVWSGPACQKCQRVEGRLASCPRHRGVIAVALQLRLMEESLK